MAEFMPIRQRKIYSVRSGINERNCKELLRFNSESVDFLAAQFLEESDTRGGTLAVSRRQQMEIFLRFVDDAGFQSGVPQDVGVHRTTVNNTIRYMMSRVVEQSHNWIRFPITAEDMTKAKVLWQRHFRLPSVMSALDCTQIEIKNLGCKVILSRLFNGLLLHGFQQYSFLLQFDLIQFLLLQQNNPLQLRCGQVFSFICFMIPHNFFTFSDLIFVVVCIRFSVHRLLCFLALRFFIFIWFPFSFCIRQTFLDVITDRLLNWGHLCQLKYYPGFHGILVYHLLSTPRMFFPTVVVLFSCLPSLLRQSSFLTVDFTLFNDFISWPTVTCFANAPQ
ncbi:hypothetical protein WA026_020404 [Henosepilachna vigintioctopunctata]|uniref:Transposase n=1 Tax=Henosepilachna vigintioctopunctata TaxID=420089 RepID=A0AAW1UIE7_9CUCU